LCMIAWNPICLLWNQLECSLISTPWHYFFSLNPVYKKMYWECRGRILALCSGTIMEGVLLGTGLKTDHSGKRGVVSKFPDWIFHARTERSYHTSR
jgi:hypothetical protein